MRRRNPKDPYQDRVYDWEHKLKKAVPTLAHAVDHTSDVYALVRAVHQSVGVTSPQIHFWGVGNNGKVRSAPRLGMWHPDEKKIYLLVPPAVGTILHECSHSIAQRMYGYSKNRADGAHGTIFQMVQLEMIKEAAGESAWGLAIAIGLQCGLPMQEYYEGFREEIARSWRA